MGIMGMIRDYFEYEGKKMGYEEASDEYTIKFLAQAKFFRRQLEEVEMMQQEYEQLLDNYESEIETLIANVNRTEDENEMLHELLNKERQVMRSYCQKIKEQTDAITINGLSNVVGGKSWRSI